MTVAELITQLSTMPPDVEVHVAYDGNFVVATPAHVVLMSTEAEIADCWWRVKLGDVVILSNH
jgi:hypothetical protein